MTLQYVRIPAYNNKLVQGWKNMCNLRFCSQLLVPIIMHFYFYFMQKSADLFDLILLFFPIRFSKTSIINWANKTKFIIRKFQTTTWPDFNEEWLLYSNFQNVFPQKKDQQKSKRFSKIKKFKKNSTQHCAKVILEIVRNSDDRYVFVLEEWSVTFSARPGQSQA